MLNFRTESAETEKSKQLADTNSSSLSALYCQEFYANGAPGVVRPFSGGEGASQMAVSNGSITVNGINDSELVKILEIKIRHEKSLTFNPQELNPTNQGQPQHEQRYNNAVFTWQNEDGLEAVREIVSTLLKKEKESKPEAA